MTSVNLIDWLIYINPNHLIPISSHLLPRPTNDKYKSYVIVNLEIPTDVVDFESKLRQQLQNYNRIGNQSASLDDDFYFRLTLGKFSLSSSARFKLPSFPFERMLWCWQTQALAHTVKAFEQVELWAFKL